MGVFGASKVDEEDDDLQYGDVIDVHAREADTCGWSVVELVPSMRVELSKIVRLGPGQSEPDIVEQEYHLHRAVRNHDSQRHQVELSSRPRGAGLVVTIPGA